MSDTRDLFHSPDMENMLIGALLMDRDAIASVHDTLAPDDFGHHAAKRAYEAALRCWARREPTDLGTLADELDASNGSTDHYEYLATCTTTLIEKGFGTHAPFYAARIRRAAQRRRFTQTYTEQLGRLMSEPDYEPMDAVAALAEAVSSADPGDGPRSFADLVPETTAVIEMERDPSYERHITPTGFQSIDATLNGGFRQQDLIFWGARTSHGKTAVAAELMHAAAKHGRVLFFSLEMNTGQFVRRNLSRESAVTMDTIQRAKFSEDEYGRYVHAGDMLREVDIWVDDTPGLTTDRMIARTQRLQREAPLSLVVVDYLELIGDGRDDAKGSNEQSRISRIVTQLKLLNRICNVPVVCLCQVSRDVDLRADKMPTLAHLRWSAMIEQTADLVFFMTVHDRYVALGMEEPDEDKRNIADVSLAKHRNGALGRYELLVDAETFKYRDAREEQRERAYATQPDASYEYDDQPF